MSRQRSEKRPAVAVAHSSNDCSHDSPFTGHTGKRAAFYNIHNSAPHSPTSSYVVVVGRLPHRLLVAHAKPLGRFGV